MPAIPYSKEISVTIPIPMPDLIIGAGGTPAEGACLLQAITWLSTAGREWNDAPDCVHYVLRRAAIRVNDTVSKEARRQLWPLVPRLMGTATGDRKQDARIGVALAAWSAEKVLPLIRDDSRRALAGQRIAAARAWLDNGTRPAAAAAYAAAAYAAAAYAAADAAADAYAYAAADADAAADAYADAAAYAAAAYAADARVKFLVDLIDEYDRITGRTEAASVPLEDWEALRAALTGSTSCPVTVERSRLTWLQLLGWLNADHYEPGTVPWLDELIVEIEQRIADDQR